MLILSRMIFLVSERIIFFKRVISSYHISHLKCLAWVKRVRNDDRDDLLTSVWTKIVDRNHHYWSLLVTQIFIISICLTADSWYTISWHRKYRWGSYSDLQIAWSGYQKKKWHSLWTVVIDALTDSPRLPKTNDNDVALVCFSVDFTYEYNRGLVLWSLVSRKIYNHDSQIQIEISHCSYDWLDDDGRDEISTLIMTDVYI